MSKLLEHRKAYGEAVDKLEALAEAGGEAFDAAKKALDELGAKINRLAEVERLKAESAKALEGQPGGGGNEPTHRTYAAPKQSLEKGANLSRLITALAANQGIPSIAAGWAEKTWGSDEGGVIAKALAVGAGGTGGFLVPSSFRAELIELLRPESIVMASGPRIIELPNGNLTIPGVATGATAEYVGENQNRLKSEQTFRQITLTAKKLSTLVPMSNDMLRYPTVSADTFVRDDLLAAMSQRSDLALIRGAGTVNSPKGLLQFAIEAGGAQYFTCSTTVTLDQVTRELAKCELAMLNGNVRMRKPVWFFSPRTMTFLSTLRDAKGNFAFPEMSKGLLRNKPYKTTTQIPDNIGGTSVGSEVYLADFSEFIIGESPIMEIEVVKGATYHDGNQLISGLSQDQTVITALTAHDSAMRQSGAVVVMTDVRWNPA